MNFRTFERLLHSKDEWHQSIEDARTLLGYNPSWSWDERRQWDDRDWPYDRQHNNFAALTLLAEKALDLLGFRGNKALELYWMACFYNDYGTLGVDAIMLWPSHWDSPRRVFPYIEWHAGFDSDKQEFHVRFHKDIPIDEIAKELKNYKAVITGEPTGVVSQDIHRAKVRRETFIEKPEITDQMRRVAIGELNFVKALQEEYEKAVQNEFDVINSIANRDSRQDYLRRLRRKVTERVRNRFRRHGLPTDYKHVNWWGEIEESFLSKQEKSSAT